MDAPHSRLVAFALSLCLSAGCGPKSQEVPEHRNSDESLPPSVILISWDTVRRDHLSVYEYERDTTPFLSEFSQECVVFDNAYTTSAFTLTAHMSMLTGLYPHTHGVELRTALSPQVPTLAERLRELSYNNIAVFRSGWIDTRYGYDRGFDVFQARNSAQLAESAVRKALAEKPKNRPYFLFLHLFDAHCGNLKADNSTIYHPPPAYRDLFLEGAAERLRGRPAEALYNGKAELKPGEDEDIIALYDASIRYLDDKLRIWINEWESAGYLDNTIIILTADHGEALGQHDDNWYGHGGLYQEGLRVPLLVRFPDGKGAGTRNSRLTSLVDLVPTILDLTKSEKEPWLQGLSLTEPREPGSVVMAERLKNRAIIDGDIKLVSNVNGERVRFYDLKNDPGELNKIKGKESMGAHYDRLVQSAQVLQDKPVPGSPIPAGKTSEEMRQDLDALGYSGDDE